MKRVLELPYETAVVEERRVGPWSSLKEGEYSCTEVRGTEVFRGRSRFHVLSYSLLILCGSPKNIIRVED